MDGRGGVGEGERGYVRERKGDRKVQDEDRTWNKLKKKKKKKKKEKEKQRGTGQKWLKKRINEGNDYLREEINI